jgi:hypothetical protein
MGDVSSAVTADRFMHVLTDIGQMSANKLSVKEGFLTRKPRRKKFIGC